MQPITRRPGALGRTARSRRVVGLSLALTVLAAACASEADVSPTVQEPTFARVEAAAFRLQEPVATLGGLLPPTGDAPWTIVGHVFDPGAGTSIAVTWASADGRSWERTDVTPASSEVSEVMSAAAATDDGRIAVGRVGEDDDSRAGLWREEDGDWALDTDVAFPSEHPHWAFDIAVGADGILVAGGESVWGDVRTRLWFSPDGVSFEAVDGGPGGAFDAAAHSTVRAVTAAGGGFVAVGSTDDGSTKDGAAWRSPDGRAWERVDAPTLAGEGRQELLTVASAGDGVVAGGFRTNDEGQGRPVIWRSPDGETWGEPSPTLPAYEDDRTDTADLRVRSVTVDEKGITAAGGSDWRPHLWRSNDGGESWSRLKNPVSAGLFEDGAALVDAATHEGVTVAAGREATVMRLQEDRWLDVGSEAFPKGGVQPFASAFAADGERLLAAGGIYTPPAGNTRERYVGQVWRRGEDGWAEAEADSLAAGRILDVAPFAGGFVAVGFEDFGQAAERLIGNTSPNGLIWSSEDGNDWRRVGAARPTTPEDILPVLAENDSDPELLASIIAGLEGELPPETVGPAGGEGTRSLNAVAPLGDGFIAVGVAFDEDRSDPLVVVSDDGSEIRGEDPDLGGGRTPRFTAVCTSPDGEAIAVGVAGPEGDVDVRVRHRDREGSWSTPGARDDSFGGPGNQQAHACAASDEGFVLVGSEDRAGRSDARVWTSPDGRTWTRLRSGALGGPGEQRARAVAPVPGGGWLVGGSDSASGSTDAALWHLDPDGHVTRRDQGEPALGGPGDQSISDLLVDEDGVLLVGEDQGRVGLWESDRLDR